MELEMMASVVYERMEHSGLYTTKTAMNTMGLTLWPHQERLLTGCAAFTNRLPNS